MAAYVIVHATIKNPEKMAEYAAVAGPSIASFGGQLLARGEGMDSVFILGGE